MPNPELESLVARHQQTARRVARRFAPRLPVGFTVDDLEAAVWVECWQAIERADGRELHGELDGYVFGAALLAARKFCSRNRNRGVRYVPRKRTLRVASEAHDDERVALADLAVAPEAAADERTEWPFDQWQEVLSRLTPRARRGVILRVFDGLSHAEVARTMGLSPSVVEREWYYALRVLRVLFPDMEPELAHA